MKALTAVATHVVSLTAVATHVVSITAVATHVVSITAVARDTCRHAHVVTRITEAPSPAHVVHG